MTALLGTLTALFPLWALGASLLALYDPRLFTWFSGPLIPLGLGVIMLGMGVTLDAGAFRRVASTPRAVVLGVVLQYTVMPAMGWTVASLMNLPAPFAVGLILVACCPGGTASNVISFLALADVPLSVTMTAISTLLAVVMTPALTALLASSRIEVPAAGLLISTVQVVILPVVAGVLLTRYAPRVTRAVLPAAPLVAVLMITLIVASIIGAGRNEILAAGPRLLIAVALLHACGFLLGYVLSRLLKAPVIVARTISIEVGMQNSGLGVVLARQNFANPLVAIPSAISSLFHSLIASVLAGIWRRSAARHHSRAVLVAIGLSTIVVAPGIAEAQEAKPFDSAQGKPRWYKGNTHTHTLNSDGDSTPDEVVRWYREHRYNFLVLTDHNFLTSVDGLNALHGADEQFLVIRGEEVSDTFEGKPLHINGVDIAERVPPQRGTSVVDVLQRNVDAIRRVKGIPHINHPNFRWAITTEELRQVRNNKLFEIYNGHPEVNNLGGGGVPGLEQIWDGILSNGNLLYGIAVDDAHVFKRHGPTLSGPGRGWIVVRAAKLETRTLLEAIERGDFYASTGVELADYSVSGTAMTVTVRPAGTSKYRIQFIGSGGKLLKEALESPATYEFRGDESYVRAKIVESNGTLAWCQPTMVARKSAASWLFAGAVLAIAGMTVSRRSMSSSRAPNVR
jgi:BASS family bile acid:Na+ symporter